MTGGRSAGARAAAARVCSGWVGLLILGLTACGDPRDNPAWSLGGEPGLLFAVKQYYELNAFEEDGYCPNPLLEGVTHSRVTQEDAGPLKVEIGYYYRDAFRNDHDCDRSFLRCGVMRACQGFAERSFVVAKVKDQLKVVEMSGPKRGFVQQPPPLAFPKSSLLEPEDPVGEVG
jgi:hypothetical protein